MLFKLPNNWNNKVVLPDRNQQSLSEKLELKTEYCFFKSITVLKHITLQNDASLKTFHE